MDFDRALAFTEAIWDEEIVPALVDYIRIPNKSPAFDSDWRKHGHMDKAVALFEAFAREKLKALPGAKLDVVRLKDRTPLIFMEVPATAGATASKSVAAAGRHNDDHGFASGRATTVLMYGHLDKQPEMTGWADGTGPWTPVLKDNRLYGRGGADDGYAMFAALGALLALKQQGIAHARIVILIEACEESGSPDLPFYIDHLAARIGTPDLVVCLDSGCGDYDRLWLTTSLRGMVIGKLTVKVLTEGVHSGDASGIVPSSFRIARALLSRIEDEATGQIKLKELFVKIPPERVAQAKSTAKILGNEVWDKMPFAGGTTPMGAPAGKSAAPKNAELILNRSWRPQLAVTAIDGYPLPANGGNVLLPYTTLKLSLRLPPTCDGARAGRAVKAALEKTPPCKAEVAFEAPRGETGWNAPALAPWLEKALNKASKHAFGRPVAFMGEGGSIPFMAMLGKRFPKTQFVVTGVLGPHSNAHGPNEFLDIPTAKRICLCIASVLADHASRA